MSRRYAPQIAKSKLRLIKARIRFVTGSLLMTVFMLLTVLNGRWRRLALQAAAVSVSLIPRASQC